MSETRDKKTAVALSYDGQHTPVVTAKGQDLLAEEIIALARANGIHIHEDPHLANFLNMLELGEAIPKELYLLIAELLAFVYMLDGKFPEQWNNLHKKIVTQV